MVQSTVTKRAKFWIRVVGAAAVVAGGFGLWSRLPALLWGARVPGAVVSVGGALSPTDGRDAYSAVIEYTPPGGTPARIERALQGRSGQRFLFGDAAGRRLQEGHTVTVAHSPMGAEILHVHARWAAAVWIVIVGLFLFAMGTVLPVTRPGGVGPVEKRARAKRAGRPR